MQTPTQLPNRQEMKAHEEAEAQLYLRNFDPRRYSGYYRRIYEPTPYLNEVGIEKICELIEHGNGVLNVAEALDISGTTLRKWVGADTLRLNKVKMAHTFAGNAFAYKAERVLLDAQYRGKEAINWASKMADHYRWMASKLDREAFGEVKDDSSKRQTPLTLNFNMGGKAKIEEEALEGECSPVVDMGDVLALMNNKS